MKHLLLVISLVIAPLQSVLAIDPGTAQGSLQIGSETIALSQACAQLHDNAEGLLDRPKELRILLTDREVPQAALNGIVFLPVEQMAKEGQVRGLLLRLDPADCSHVLVTLLYPPASPGQLLMTQTSSVTGREAMKKLNMGALRVQGEIEYRDQGEPDFTDLPNLVYAVQFSAPLFHEPAITADLKGKAAQDSPQVQVLREKASALAKADFAAVRRFSSKRANRQTDAFFAQGGAQAAAFAKEAGAEMEQSIGSIQRVVVRGERAVAIFSDQQWVDLVREGGEWKADN
jgi:hypothetical protein